MLRIIAGNYRQRKIETPDLKITRPTTDKVREAIFSSLHFDLPSSICLDLFSGSGAMAIEAVSRGALKVIASEKNPKIFKILQNNLNTLGINNIDAYLIDALALLKLKQNTEYDFIFLDPPYEKIELLNECLKKIQEYKLLKKYGKIIIETNNFSLVIIPKGFNIIKTKKYGKTTILFITKI
ncbi:16S rRNA (guanine(966)-N(2))-methyltransferase RsmD [Mycoplasma iguanae]|uniref:16S rRNA (Guanine(966)-N(2))-methyltransferase RsmD n=1 Tax=Mycoplasma iguanae TaxID=292461 RepID=A0ABY5RAF2_9MOLU|nr:16S rRNA (guanine(966)-N(2))-methyltransferase RsmD [Mycoplasma iguanae]UVD81759.1 16S rRNA (guanine(966)-N(2))-methyltransferase RsmD [Mycoplasma iguanae]